MSVMDIFTLIISIIGALAWLPYIISAIINHCAKIDAVLLNYKILRDGISYTDNRTNIKKGTIILLQLNLFTKGADIFIKDLKIKIIDKNNSEINCDLTDVSSTYKTGDNGETYHYVVKDEENLSQSKTIKSKSNNIKFLSIMVEGFEITDLEKQIKKIQFIVNNKKKFEINSEKFPKYGQSKKFDSVEELYTGKK